MNQANQDASQGTQRDDMSASTPDPLQSNTLLSLEGSASPHDSQGEVALSSSRPRSQSQDESYQDRPSLEGLLRTIMEPENRTISSMATEDAPTVMGTVPINLEDFTENQGDSPRPQDPHRPHNQLYGTSWGQAVQLISQQRNLRLRRIRNRHHRHLQQLRQQWQQRGLPPLPHQQPVRMAFDPSQGPTFDDLESISSLDNPALPHGENSLQDLHYLDLAFTAAQSRLDAGFEPQVNSLHSSRQLGPQNEVAQDEEVALPPPYEPTDQQNPEEQDLAGSSNSASNKNSTNEYQNGENVNNSSSQEVVTRTRFTRLTSEQLAQLNEQLQEQQLRRQIERDWIILQQHRQEMRQQEEPHEDQEQ